MDCESLIALRSERERRHRVDQPLRLGRLIDSRPTTRCSSRTCHQVRQNKAINDTLLRSPFQADLGRADVLFARSQTVGQCLAAFHFRLQLLAEQFEARFGQPGGDI